MTGYPHTSNTYQPAYNYNNQVGYSAQPRTTNADTRDYSPDESSSYRWRETYVKLRQQEQERYSKPTLSNLRKLSKLPGNSYSKIPENSMTRTYPKKEEIKDSRKIQSPGKNAKPVSGNFVKSGKTFSQRLYNQLLSQIDANSQLTQVSEKKKTLPKGANSRHKKVGKPGVFLRKKASKKNSFLAFLPNEVTENESLLQNVYNMLSVMLKRLRKHKKNSMKNLKKYLKLPQQISVHQTLHTDPPKKPVVRGFQRANAPESPKVNSSYIREDLSRHPSLEGQKQLSKAAKNSAMTYASREEQRLGRAGNLVGNQVTGKESESGSNMNRVQDKVHDAKLRQPQTNKTLSSAASTTQTHTKLSQKSQNLPISSKLSRKSYGVEAENKFKVRERH